MRRKLKNHQGFTLVELMVVIAIVGILLTIGISRLNPALQFQRGNDARRKADLAKVQTALELFRSDQQNYPVTSTGLNALLLSTPQYMSALPKDPKTNSSTNYLFYTASSTPNVVTACDNSSTFCSNYFLVVCLENTADTDKDATNDATKCTSPLWSKTVTNQ